MNIHDRRFWAMAGLFLALILGGTMPFLSLEHVVSIQADAESPGLPKRQDEVKERQVSVMLENATYLFLPRTGRCWAYFEEYSASARVPKRSLDEVRCSLARYYMSEYSLRLLEREEARLGPIK